MNVLVTVQTPANNIKLLLMNPDWVKENYELLTFLESKEDKFTFHYEIRNPLRKLLAIKNKLPASRSNYFEIKTYKTVFPFIITGYDSHHLVKAVIEITDYIPTEKRPRFYLHKISGNEFFIRK